MNSDRELLNRYLDGNLDGEATARLDERLGEDPSLRTELHRLQQVRMVVAEGRANSFGPYFSDRVMRRLAPVAEAIVGDPFYAALRSTFTRTAIAGLVVAGVLAGFNLASYGGLDVVSTIPEALLGLPSASILDALTYNGL